MTLDKTIKYIPYISPVILKVKVMDRGEIMMIYFENPLE